MLRQEYYAVTNQNRYEIKTTTFTRNLQIADGSSATNPKQNNATTPKSQL